MESTKIQSHDFFTSKFSFNLKLHMVKSVFNYHFGGHKDLVAQDRWAFYEGTSYSDHQCLEKIMVFVMTAITIIIAVYIVK